VDADAQLQRVLAHVTNDESFGGRESHRGDAAWHGAF